MTDRAQFEAMLEALINEDQDAAKEIFHNIVVAKSREIYEELLAEDFQPGDTGNPYRESAEEEEEEETTDDDTDTDGDGEADSEENPFGGDDSEEDDAEGEVDGEEDPFASDDEEGGEGEGDIEDRVMDLEDALEDLKAEFEHLLAGEEHEEEENPGIHGGELDGMLGGDEGGDMGGADMGAEDEMAGLMEYTIKVPGAKHGDNGVNNKSIVAGKNDMGGTTANIAKSFSTTSGGTQGGLLKPTTSVENFGNVNVPGGKAGKTGFKKQEPGHGAEKAGKKETSDKSAGSVLNGAPKRAK